MFRTYINAFKVKDLRNKILFTLLLMVVYRLGSAIPIPGIDVAVWSETVKSYALFEYMSVLSGSALSQFTLFAMGISPYITASIILQLLQIAIPALEKMSKEEDGRQKIERITRYVGVGLAIVQSIGIVVTYGSDIVTDKSFMGYLTIAVCSAAGTALLMWMGERITEKGIGNGISMLIFFSIVSRVPEFLIELTKGLISGQAVWQFFVTLIVMLVLITFVVFIDKAVRKIPIQYAKRVVGRKMYGGSNTYLPMKANQNGVLPLIFAMTIMQVPTMIFQFAKSGSGFAKAGAWYEANLSSTAELPIPYYVIYFLLIIAFGYFYSAITFNPIEISKNLQENGGAIPGIRMGKPTGEYLAKVNNRLTLFGSLFLAVIAIVPTIVLNEIGVTDMFGATSVLIMVSVALETTEQLESQMLMRHYKGFLN
ncbi:MAG TPA: preprotein translocase subunit SecY [Eubacteriales bacterium]|nr:preprotein translocase subunit SecY [Clostridia bacterium]HRV73425.1 preprotein translocase subunit SecY [Eubacteriales bacterium]